MAKLADESLLKTVRLELLQRRANGAHGFGLSSLVASVSPTLYVQSYTMNAQALVNRRSRFTSGGLKTYRGKVQWCLTRLAATGLLYTRRKPEGGVASYEHGERDKGFRFRITQTQAIESLRQLNVPVRAEAHFSPHYTPSLSRA